MSRVGAANRAALVSRDGVSRLISCRNSPQGCGIILSRQIKALGTWWLGACLLKSSGKAAVLPALSRGQIRKFYRIIPSNRPSHVGISSFSSNCM